MKKTLASLVAFVFIFSGSSAFAQMPVSVPGMMPAVSAALEKVGVVAAAQGKVKLSMPGEAGHIAESGEAVFISQEVATDAKGHLQILLLDETVFTIGPNSAITIDKFVYDPKSHAGEIRASIAKGIFRYVSGKIAAKKSDSVSMKLPTATIGFRGTIVGGSVEGNGQGLVALLGPGDNNDANAPIGSFSIEGQDGDHQDVNRTGFGVEVGASGGLSGVFQLSDEQVNGLTSGLAPSGDRGQTGGTGGQTGGGGDQGGVLGGGNMGSLSGETGALTSETSSLTGSLTNLTDGLDDASNQASQDAAANSDKAADGATTYEQLARVTTGTGHYDFSSVYKNLSGSPVGTMTGKAVIDFGNQLFGVAGTDVTVTQGGYSVTTFDNTYQPQSFSNISSAGAFNFKDAWGFDESANHVGDFDITIALSNQNGTTAEQATAAVKYVKTSGMVDSGTTTATASLQSGS